MRVKESFNNLYALAHSEALEFQSFNIATAFLNGQIYLPVHTMQFKVFEDEHCNIVLLNQFIYGAKQAHQQSNTTLKTLLASIGLHSTEVNDYPDSKRLGDNLIHIRMNVNDSLCVSNFVQMIAETRAQIESLYEVKWNSTPTKHLGIKICCDCP